MRILLSAILCIVVIGILSRCRENPPEELIAVEEEWKVDPNTGLIKDEGMNQIVINCNPCHSSQTVTQFRASREGWKEVITWMQEEQKLWDLGEMEDDILDYLAKHYAPEEKSYRRSNLEEPEWYILKE